MPVSLMTGYFSTELENVSFSVRAYWIWFGVVLGTSVVGLAVFSYFGKKRDANLIETSFARSAVDLSRSIVSSKRSD
jgi:hypothetical protein